MLIENKANKKDKHKRPAVIQLLFTLDITKHSTANNYVKSSFFQFLLVNSTSLLG
uniref:Uncharacterized protein n=1 Tax=Rhizophora mucronata TaxID=61149 RepID=A0A2P2NIU0_RHIMU